MGMGKAVGRTLAGFAIAGLGFGAALTLLPFGTDDPYGTNPNKEIKNPKYPPKVFAAVYMTMRQDPNGAMSWDIQEQFFDLASRNVSPKALNEMVEQIYVQRFRANNWNDGSIPPIPESTVWLPLPNTSGTYAPSTGMADLYYGKPVKIFVFIDNKGIEFQKAWPITFSKYSGDALEEEKLNAWAQFKRDPNDTFFNAKVGAEGFSSNQFLTYDNLYRSKDCWWDWCSAEGKEEDPSGSKWPAGQKKYRNYAINYNIRVPSGVPGKIIPIAIDPDTGNGTGSPPPVEK